MTLELGDRCSGRMLDLERLCGRTLSRREQADLVLHVSGCSACQERARWMHASNAAIRTIMQEPRSVVALHRRVGRRAASLIESRLAGLLDSAGVRLLIAAGGGRHRVVHARVPQVPVLLSRMVEEARSLRMLDESEYLRPVSSVLRRFAGCTPGSPRALLLARTAFSLAETLDPELPRPILHQIQVAPADAALARINEQVDEVLCLSDDPFDRALALVELASLKLERERSVSSAFELTRSALKQEPSKLEVVGAAQLMLFLNGGADHGGFGRALASACKPFLRQRRGSYVRKAQRAIKSSMVWLRDTGWLDETDRRRLQGAVARMVP